MAAGLAWLITSSFWGALAAYAAAGAAATLLLAVAFCAREGTPQRAAEMQPDMRAVSRPCVASVQPDNPQDQIAPNWWQRVAHGNSGRHAVRAIYVADATQEEAERLALTLTGQGLDVDICNDLDVVLASITEAPQRWSALIVDLDLAERRSSLQAVIDDLCGFRQAVPDVPVVLLSTNFSRDEMELHRHSVADVSLRSPVIARSLVEGLMTAKANNDEWVKRQQTP
ncbi:MAG: hypothetical protein JJT99_14855 [Rhodobacteraceae bacterium]|nr:hypothetical protein [Paracoccaceae bacterium]